MLTKRANCIAGLLSVLAFPFVVDAQRALPTTSWRDLLYEITPIGNRIPEGNGQRCLGAAIPKTATLIARANRQFVLSAWAGDWTFARSPIRDDTLLVAITAVNCDQHGTPLRLEVTADGKALAVLATQIPGLDSASSSADLVRAANGERLEWLAVAGRVLGLMTESQVRDTTPYLRATAVRDSIQHVADELSAKAASDAKDRAAFAAAEATSEALIRERRSSLLARGWSRAIVTSVMKRELVIGMTPAMVRAAWGEPSQINRTIDALGASEQWVYGYRAFAYFTDGKLTTIQDTP